MSQSIIKFEHKSSCRKALAGLLALLLSFGVVAQEQALEENLFELPSNMPMELPGIEHLTVSLSDKASRLETLLTMVVVDRLLAESVAPGQLEARWQDERAWLDRLAAHFSVVPLRSSAMDSSAWFVLLELDRHQLVPSSLVSPQGPNLSILVRQLFDRSDERLAAALLPEVLTRMESESIHTWHSMLTRAAGNDDWLALLLQIDESLARPRLMAELAADGEDENADPFKRALDNFQVLAASIMQVGVPDLRRLARVRYALIGALPEMDDRRAGEAAQLLRLATAVDGLRENRYLQFAETLLSVVTDMLLAENMPLETVQPVSELPHVLVELLPQISNSFSREFSDTDPRINTVLATAFDVVQSLQNGSFDTKKNTYLHQALADAVAQLVLMIPDMNFYFEQPVREQIAGEIDLCTRMVAATFPDNKAALSRQQFDRCLVSLADLSETTVRKAELAGDPDGPFAADQLRRELQLTPWQRINYALGYLHERYTTSCEFPDEPLPNPLEWAVLATSLAWLAEQSPVYFQTPENEALVVQMRKQGTKLLQTMQQQVVCFSRSGKGINDPVRRSLFAYRRALEALGNGIGEAELAFRQERLASGADIVLSGDAHQETAYRTEGLMIGPCQKDRICEMNGELESTRALIGLFPDQYLIADQTGLGKIEICYDNMSWVQRRSELIRPDDPNVANYFGRLSFDLIGRYVEDGVVSKVFGSNFISPEEYLYLFAAARDEVLDDSCPTELIGSKIVTGLRGDNSFRVVPDRLTYLTSARSQPSQIIASNWSSGAEWRDWFVTGLGVTPFEYRQDETITVRVNQHLKSLYQEEQAILYSTLLSRPSRNSSKSEVSLYKQMTEVDTSKKLVRFYMSLFYPDLLMDSDEIRGFLEGSGALVDGPMLRRFKEGNVPVESINDIAVARLTEFNARWIRLLKPVRRSGSVALNVAHSITRLNALYQEFFALPPRPVENGESIQAPPEQ